MHPYACLLWQEWREAKDQLSFALSVDACIASEVGIAQNPGKKWESTTLAPTLRALFPWCHKRPVLSYLCPPGLQEAPVAMCGGAVGFASPPLPGSAAEPSWP